MIYNIIVHVSIYCVLTSQLSIVRGQFGTARPKDLHPSSDVSFPGVTSKRKAILEVASASTTTGLAEARTIIRDTVDYGISPSVTLSHFTMLATVAASLPKLPTNEVTVFQSSSTFTKEHQHYLSVGNITSYVSLESSSTTKFSQNETISYSKFLELESTYSTVLLFQVQLADEATLLSSPFLLRLHTSSVNENLYEEKEMSLEQQAKTVATFRDIQLSSATKIFPTSLTSVLFPSSIASVPTMRSPPRAVPGKPSHVDATGEKNNVDFSGAITPEAKIAIGIVVTLCILGVVVTGVVVYRRYNFTHGGMKSSLTSDVRYKTYNSSKDDEGMLIMPDRR